MNFTNTSSYKDIGGVSFSKQNESNMLPCEDPDGNAHVINIVDVSYTYSSIINSTDPVLVDIFTILKKHQFWFMIGNVEVECSVPTQAPTDIPTSAPSQAPTNAPSVAPSVAPSPPTNAPTLAPSFSPTTPSVEPTPVPTTIFGEIPFAYTSTEEFSGEHMTIGWLEYMHCTEGFNNDFIYNPEGGGLNGLLDLVQYAVTVKILPSSDIPGQNETAAYTVMADLCSNPIYALNNGYSMSFTVNETSDTPVVIDYANISNWIGDNAAALTANGCFYNTPIGSEPETLASEYIYHTCGNGGGLHIIHSSGYKVCGFNSDGDSGHNVSIYLGFDVNQELYCEYSNGSYGLMTEEPTIAPSMAPSKAPTQPPTVNPTSAPSQAPTTAPSLAPSVAPSPPTNAPTLSPSKAPTSATTTNQVAMGFMNTCILSGTNVSCWGSGMFTTLHLLTDLFVA